MTDDTQAADSSQPIVPDEEIRPRFPWSSLAGYRNRGYFYAASFIERAALQRSAVGAVLRILGYGVRGLLLGITPPAEARLWQEVKRHNVLAVWVAAFITTFIFSFVFNAWYSNLAKTFYGTDTEHHQYFWNDWHNKAIYAIIAPFYVSFSVVVIYSTFKWITVRFRAADRTGGQNWWLDVLRMVLVTSLLILAAGQVQVSYFNSNVTAMSMKPTASRSQDMIDDCKRRTYWFMEDTKATTAAGDVLTTAQLDPRRYLNSAGIYYLTSQFLRQLIVFAAVVCFAAASLEMWRFGRELEAKLSPSDKALEETQVMVTHYTIVEIAMKGLAGALTWHFAVWGDSCLRGSNNIKVATVAVFIIGFLLLMIPRQFVEHRLMRWMVRHNLHQRVGGEWPSLIPRQDAWAMRTVTWGFWAVLGYFFLLTGILPNPLVPLIDWLR